MDSIETTATARSPSLSCNPTTDQYTYVWKTDKKWAGKCGSLQLTFNDGTMRTAAFQFKR